MAGNSVYSTLLTAAVEARSKTIQDAISNHNALLWILKDKNLIKPYEGGTKLLVPVVYDAPGSNVVAYSGMDLLPTTDGEFLTNAEYNICNYHTSVVLSGEDERANSGKQKIIDLLTAKVDAAEKMLINRIVNDLYSDGSDPKSLVGIAAAISVAPTTGTYAGIDRSLAGNQFWRNKAQTGTVITSENIFAEYLKMHSKLVRGADRPDVILACADHWQKFLTMVHSQNRFEGTSSSKLANAGFQNISFMNTPVVVELGTGGSATTFADDQSYFLNTRGMAYRPFKSFDLRNIESPVVAQDAQVRRMFTSSAFVVSAPFLSGTIQG